MTNIGRPSVWDQHGERMQQLYEQDNRSRGDIARYFGTSVQTVTRVLIRRGVTFEDRQGAPAQQRSPEDQAAINAKISAAKSGHKLGPRKPSEMRSCENRPCGRQFEYHAGQTGERFCSRTCRNEYASFVNKAAAKDAYELDPRRCPCDTAIPFEHRHNRQFCSPEHRKIYAAKRQPDPANYITFNCLRPACGKEFTLPRSYTSAGKYCSNECSAKHNRTKQHIVVDDAIVLDSPYEALFWGLLRLWKIPVERADRELAIAHGDGWYCPDFYLPGLDVWVEVKGYEDDDDRARCAAWRAAGRRLAILSRVELHLLRSRANDGVIREQLRIWASGPAAS
jgi:hypothetical protein